LLYDDTLAIDAAAHRADSRTTTCRGAAASERRSTATCMGRPLAARLGYDRRVLAQLPERAVESFAGVGNPHAIRPLRPGEKVLDLGSGSGFDAFVAAKAVGRAGSVIGIEVAPELLSTAREVAQQLGFANVEFREGVVEDLPIGEGWADVVIANGVLTLVDEPASVLAEAFRVLRPGGTVQFTDVATARSSSGLWPTLADWCRYLTGAGFVDLSVGPPMEAFSEPGVAAGAGHDDVHAHFFVAFKPR
jgi:SAM-dependent methyltransferase